MTKAVTNTFSTSAPIIIFDREDAFPLTNDISYDPRYETAISEACDVVYGKIIRTAKGVIPRKAMEVLKMVILNCQKSRLSLQAVYYSRRKNDYYKKGNFSRMPSYNSVRWVVDGLVASGFIAHKNGFYGARIGKDSFRSRFWPSHSLCKLMDDAGVPVAPGHPDGFEIDDPVSYKKNEQRYPVSLYNRKASPLLKPVIAYNKYMRKHKLTCVMNGDTEFNLDKLGKLLSNFTTGTKTILTWESSPILPGSLVGADKFLFKTISQVMASKDTPEVKLIRLLNLIIRFFKHGKSSSMPRTIKLSDLGVESIIYQINTIYLFRSFTNKQLTLGGRFFAKMSPEARTLRPGYKLDGLDVAEPDFQAMWTHLAYNTKDIGYTGDPYSWPLGDAYRTAVKKAILLAFTCKNSKQALRRYRRDAREKQFKLPSAKDPHKEVFKQIENEHSLICDDFYKSRWKELMFRESEIMGGILLQLAELDIPAIPFHDGLVVPKKDLVTVKQVMSDEYEKFTGFKPVIK